MCFSFGRNWDHFLSRKFSPERLALSREHLLHHLKRRDLVGQVFVDVGCGSGLHSLAALTAGARRVISFDVDPDSLRTTQTLRRMHGSPTHWLVLDGSILDRSFMNSLEPADIVYAWGVLHHTGDMWRALEHSVIPMKGDGVLYVALYTHEMFRNPPPEFWLDIKQRYNRASPLGQVYLQAWYAWRYVFSPQLRSQRNPLALIRMHKKSRGMAFWTDVRDWLGGWPTEFAKIHEVRQFAAERLGMELLNIRTGEANTEYLFRKRGALNYWDGFLASLNSESLPPPFTRESGYGWTATIPQYADRCDHVSVPSRSSLVLCENGSPLNISHAPHDEIRTLGLGRYSHWDARLLFSSSDNSDPNSNGREYSLRLM